MKPHRQYLMSPYHNTNIHPIWKLEDYHIDRDSLRRLICPSDELGSYAGNYQILENCDVISR